MDLIEASTSGGVVAVAVVRIPSIEIVRRRFLANFLDSRLLG